MSVDGQGSMIGFGENGTGRLDSLRLGTTFLM